MRARGGEDEKPVYICHFSGVLGVTLGRGPTADVGIRRETVGHRCDAKDEM